uniref:DUF202 domain-containing protein n=1 Tax=Ascaris lumbricoides TaxID=6252 RepID=A0A0M3I4Y3_ASCLU
MTFRHRRYPVMNDDTKSILLDSVYAPLELPNYSLHTALTLNWLSSVLCAIAGTTFLAAGRMECVKWAKFRYFIAHDIDAWKFRIVGCQQHYFIILAVVNWIALLIHTGAIYSIVEYKESLRSYPQTIALQFSNQDRNENGLT